jgi:hypothetical protein
MLTIKTKIKELKCGVEMFKMSCVIVRALCGVQVSPYFTIYLQR